MDDLLNWQSWQHFHLMRPYWIFLFLAFLWIYRGFIQRDDTTIAWQKYMSEKILQALTIKGTDQRLLSPQKLSFILMILMTLVLMGPSWQQQPSPFSEDKSALIIALDVSETMEQGDVQPSRLLRAKQKILELLALRGDANTALIAYSGSAHVVMPMTNDRKMIRLFLDALAPNIMPSPGKLPELSLDFADPLFSGDSHPETANPGTFLLMGDGATDNSKAIFSKYFAKSPHRLIVWAMAAPEDDNLTDSLWVPAQVEALEALAKQADGRFVRLSHDDQDVSRVNRTIEQNFAIVDDGTRPWHDSGYNLVFVIALLFLFWFRRGWTLQW